MASPTTSYAQELLAILLSDDEPEELDGLPQLSPSTWQAYRDRCRCGSCSLCKHFQRIERDAFSAPWRDTPTQRSAEPDRARWASVTAALAYLVDLREAGFTQGSASGCIEALGGLGARIQQGERKGSRAEREAEDALYIQRALESAYDSHNSRGLSIDTCITVLLSRTVGISKSKTIRGKKHIYRELPTIATLATQHNVSEAIIIALVKSGKGRVAGYLIEKGLLNTR